MSVAPSELQHYGVLGMKWGVRKDRSSTSNPRHGSKKTSKSKKKKQVKKLKEIRSFRDFSNWLMTQASMMNTHLQDMSRQAQQQLIDMGQQQIMSNEFQNMMNNTMQQTIALDTMNMNMMNNMWMFY